MMTYTDEEIRASVEKLMASKTEFQRDARSGVRRTEVTFNAFQEAIASVLLLDHSSLFYLSGLAAKRLRHRAASYRETVQKIYDWVGTLERKQIPIDDVTPLEDAKAALLQLEAVSSDSRSNQLASSPSYARFTEKVDTFLVSVKKNVVYPTTGGDIVPSIIETRSLINLAVSGLATTHEELVERLQKISQLQSTYSELDLPYRMVASTVIKARKLVGYKAYRIKNQSEEQNQLEIRDTVLDLLSAKGVLRRASLFAAPQSNRTMTGTASPYADSTREASPAQVVVTGPFDIRDTSGSASSNLIFEFDGDPTQHTVELPAVTETLAVQGTSSGPFTILTSARYAQIMSDAIGSPSLAIYQNLKLYLGVYDDPDLVEQIVTTVFTSGAHTASSLASEIQSAITAASMDAYFTATAADGRVYITANQSGSNSEIGVVSMSDSLLPIFGQSWRDLKVYGEEVNDTLSIRAGASSSPDEEYFQFLSGSYTVEAVVDRINSLKPPSFPIRAEVYEVTYATPPYKVVRIVYTGSADDAVLEIVPTYDPGTGEEPALAYEAFHLYGAMEREASKMNALVFVDTLRGNDEVSANTNIDVDGNTVTISSKDTTLASEIKISGDGCSQVFGSSTVDAIGTTHWMSLSDTVDLEEGDILTIHSGSDTDYEIDSVDLPYVHLASSISSQSSSVTFDSESIPWGEVSYAKKQTLDSVSSTIDDWLDTWEDPSSYLTELTRLLNMVLADNNPTSGEINDVQAHLTGSSGLLTALDSLYSSLSSYEVPRSEDLEVALKNYREKGCDRAVDLLLEGRLDDFFGLTMEDSSYSGRMTKAIKEVAAADMPVGRSDRDAAADRVLSATKSIDYDRDFSDSEDEFGDEHFAIDAE